MTDMLGTAGNRCKVDSTEITDTIDEVVTSWMAGLADKTVKTEDTDKSSRKDRYAKTWRAGNVTGVRQRW
jgi:hypothetical protein